MVGLGLRGLRAGRAGAYSDAVVVRPVLLVVILVPALLGAPVVPDVLGLDHRHRQALFSRQLLALDRSCDRCSWESIGRSQRRLWLFWSSQKRHALSTETTENTS